MILKVLMDNNCMGRAVYMVRRFGGQLLGLKTFPVN